VEEEDPDIVASFFSEDVASSESEPKISEMGSLLEKTQEVVGILL